METSGDFFMLPLMVYRFGDFELDTAKVELRAAGEAGPLEPQVFALLAQQADDGITALRQMIDREVAQLNTKLMESGVPAIG